jgi:DNA helicase-2/ATP-dependent DNA helicase PcrA
MTLQYSGSELATLQKLTARIYQETAGNSSLKNTINTLNEIIASERFEGVEEDNDDCYISSRTTDDYYYAQKPRV